ncbi:uncharacterized protein TEOVI_000892200 [Trypanosoma equiperdum]|uniref:Trypanosome variant surface glycoprotein (A-type) n=1 Tax=Trypanosoma equiperdum TaxID=5694 RepID=A0A1G4HZ84_TRYEQ|nr:hypothetical protein TEOVI_000892200 [Trypanosoma equiperdum]
MALLNVTNVRAETDTAAVSDFCTELWYGEELMAGLQGKVARAAEATTKAAREAELYKLAQERYADTQQGTGYTALAAYAAQKAQATATAASTLIGQAMPAIAVLSAKIAELKTIQATTEGTTAKAGTGTAEE